MRFIIGAQPVASKGSVFDYGPTSTFCRIPLSKGTLLAELDATVKSDDEGVRVTLTAAAYAAFAELCCHAASEKVAKLEKKIELDAAKQLADNMIKSSPVKFIHDFKLNAHSFLNKPTTPMGMAQARTGMQFVTARRAQVFGLGEEEATMSMDLIQVVPIMFENEFLRKAPSKKLEDYSRVAHERLQGCIDGFTSKKRDKQYQTLLSRLREIAHK